ncbi:MAG: hypothetical protein ACOYMA_04305 [Bacteroidia bacterium]
MCKFILPECYADTTLIEVLGYNKPNHIKGIGQVINVLDKNFKNKLGIGFVDKDKNGKSKRENTEYILIIKYAHSNSLILKQKPNTKNYLIEHPNIENWLDKMADEFGIDKAKYGVSDLRTNHTRYKKQDILKNEGFKNFVNALSQKQNSPLQTVKNWIEELKKEHGVF